MNLLTLRRLGGRVGNFDARAGERLAVELDKNGELAPSVQPRRLHATPDERAF